MSKGFIFFAETTEFRAKSAEIRAKLQYRLGASRNVPARRLKQLKLTGSTTPTTRKERVKPDWRRLQKEDPVRFMALYKADYIFSMERTNLKWNKTRATPPPSVRK